MTAALPLEVKLNDKAKMKDIVLAVNTAKRAVSLRLRFQTFDPDLILTGAITVPPTGLQLEASMAGSFRSMD